MVNATVGNHLNTLLSQSSECQKSNKQAAYFCGLKTQTYDSVFDEIEPNNIDKENDDSNEAITYLQNINATTNFEIYCEALPSTDLLPKNRSQTVNLIKNKLYIFGGCDKSDNCTNKMNVYEIGIPPLT